MNEAPAYLVTGGTSGIGNAVAKHLAANGGRVWITGTREATVDAALADSASDHGDPQNTGDSTLDGAAPDSLTLAGGSVCDVADPSQVTAAFADATAALGPLDGVFVNAGIDGQGVPAQDIAAKHFSRVLQVNVLGAFLTAQAAYGALKRPGRLVVNASVNAVKPEREFTDYNVSKSAVAGLARSLALEWSAETISVTGICPGYFPSAMTQQWLDDPVASQELLSHIPAGRFGSLDEVAALVEFLLSGRADFLTGAVIPIAGASNI